jgi:plastocyanin
MAKESKASPSQVRVAGESAGFGVVRVRPSRRAALASCLGALLVLVPIAASAAWLVEPAAAVTFTLHGSTSGWGFTANSIASPGPTLTVNLGDSVTMRLFSEDQAPHTFLVDYDGDRNPDAGEPRSAVFSSRTTALVYTFTANLAGSFTYWCDIHYGRMVGTFVVQGAANTPPTVMAVSGSPSSVIPGQEVTFTGTIGDADGDVVSYTWNFGDGTTSSGTTPAGGGPVSAIHAYATTGSKTATLTANDGHGGTASGSGTVTVLQPGLLRATTSPAVNGKVIVDGVPRDEWGLNWVKIAPGSHEVSFGEIYGTRAPPPQTVQVTAGMTTEAAGVYLVYGSLRVTTEPALPATVFVNGQPANDWGMWRAVPPGEYTVSFGAVEGFDPPAPTTVTIASGGFEHVVGRFTANPAAPGPSLTYGYLRVTTNPAVSATIAVDGIDRDDWGLTWVKIPAGSHIVQFRGIYGFTTPAPIPITISLGATTEATGNYLRHGSLRVVTSPAVSSTVFVANIPRDDWGMWQSMPPGSYRVTFGPVPGYVTPAAQTAVVTAGASVTITGVFTVAGGASADASVDCCQDSCCDCCHCGSACDPHGM